MMNKLRIATIGLLAVALLIPSSVLAQEEAPERSEGATRAAGEISGVVPGQGTFTLITRNGRELEFQTNEDTNFRGPNGSVEDIHDLKKGMKALVIATVQGDSTLLAKMVAAGHPDDLPEHMRAVGKIQGIDSSNQTFALEKRGGEVSRFKAGERTKYRGEGIEDFDDLKVGMQALVAAIPQDEGPPLALLIGAREPKDRPEIIRIGGEITGVVPGQGTFTLVNHDGEEFGLSTNDRTKFFSRDGSVQGIHDLKKGMLATVGAVRQENGQLIAIVVAVGNPEDRPKLDIKAAGEVIAKGANSFLLHTRGGDEISFSVSEKTHYAGVSGFGALEVGMMAGVGAVETDEGLLALFVGAKNREDRPEQYPQDRPEGRPNRSGPNQGQDQDVSA